MKAVIMAGGKGTRLRPLTHNTPKPMVPILDRPCMEYIIELLKASGITEIAVTLQYLPEAVRRYFGDGEEWGVQLHYFEEDWPLGTAGSVKNAESFLDETFLVISGDAVTDFDLARAVEYHRAKQAVATLVLTRVEHPLEFGVVMTDVDGSIVRFLEKPSWSEVFSDTVNTGIYILEPEIFGYVDKEREADFSKDLFPLLMAERKPLYGYIAEGYWTDIGNLAQYRRTQFDMLEGKVNLPIRGVEVAPGIWADENTEIADGAQIVGPCYIGRNCSIHDRAVVGAYTVIGEGSVVGQEASLEGTVLGSNVYLNRQTELFAATLCRNVSLGLGAIIREGAVLGDGCRIGPKSVIQPEVKLPPGTATDRHAVVHHSVFAGGGKPGGLFGYSGVHGECHMGMTTGFANDLALAFGSTLPIGSTVAIGFDATPYCSLLAEAFSAGLHAAGIHTRHIGMATSSICRSITSHFGCAGGIFIRNGDGDEEACLIEFMDEQGVRISKSVERKIENTFVQEDYRQVPSGKLGQRFEYSGAVPLYRAKLLELVPVEEIRRRNYTVVVQYEQISPIGLIPELLRELGCRVIQLERGKFNREDVCRMIRVNEADFGVILDANAQRIELATERGDFVREEALALLQCLMQIHCEDKPALCLPVYLPDLAEQLALRNGRRPERTKADMRSVMQGCGYNGYHVYFDGLYTLVRFMQLMTMQGKQASQLLADIPEFTLLTRRVDCPWSEKGKVMRFLMEETKGNRVELIDGIKVYHDHGWTLILPDSDEPSFRIYSNAGDARQAEEQMLFYTKKITERHRTGKNDLQVR